MNGPGVRWLCRLPSQAVVAVVRLYQWTLGPWLGGRCRFTPSCSEYMIGAVHKYGAVLGSWKGLCRIARCHPWHPGGPDPP